MTDDAKKLAEAVKALDFIANNTPPAHYVGDLSNWKSILAWSVLAKLREADHG